MYVVHEHFRQTSGVREQTFSIHDCFVSWCEYGVTRVCNIQPIKQLCVHKKSSERGQIVFL